MLLTAKEVARILGVHPKLVYRLFDSGDLKSCRLGNGPKAPRRCQESDVAEYIERRYKHEEGKQKARRSR